MCASMVINVICKPLLINFLTRTTTFTFASPSDERGLSMISIGSLLRRLGALAVLWYCDRSGAVRGLSAILYGSANWAGKSRANCSRELWSRKAWHVCSSAISDRRRNEANIEHDRPAGCCVCPVRWRHACATGARAY